MDNQSLSFEEFLQHFDEIFGDISIEEDQCNIHEGQFEDDFFESFLPDQAFLRKINRAKASKQRRTSTNRVSRSEAIKKQQKKSEASAKEKANVVSFIQRNMKYGQEHRILLDCAEPLSSDTGFSYAVARTTFVEKSSSHICEISSVEDQEPWTLVGQKRKKILPDKHQRSFSMKRIRIDVRPQGSERKTFRRGFRKKIRVSIEQETPWKTVRLKSAEKSLSSAHCTLLIPATNVAGKNGKYK